MPRKTHNEQSKGQRRRRGRRLESTKTKEMVKREEGKVP